MRTACMLSCKYWPFFKIWATTWHEVSVRPAKTQISLGIHPVWSESSPSAWRNLGSLATHWVHSEDSGRTGQMPRLIWDFAGRTLFGWFCHVVVQFLPLAYLIKKFHSPVWDWPYTYCQVAVGLLWQRGLTKFDWQGVGAWQNQQNGLCAQWKLRSAWVSAQSDQRLHCLSKNVWGLSYP